ncbi:MAG TPA: NnrU family protein [Sphingomicrobium sp.]|nr:NnrU family protein [Sphingomicrobium sp.]
MGLFFASIAFLATHFLMSHPLRGPLVRRLGPKGFLAVYSLVAIVLFGLMIWSYGAIGRERQAWQPTEWAWGIATVLMWLGAILFTGSFVGNPALPGARGPRGGPKGVFAITRHPMMWGFAFFAISHILVIAQPKTVIFFGAILLLALIGSALQDRKKAGQMGETWHEWTAQTAFIPFGRGPAHLGWLALAGGTILYLVATWLHPIPVGLWRWIG